MDHLHDFFKNIIKREVTTEEIQAILDLQYPDGSPVFDIRDQDTVVEILSIFEKLEQEEAMDYLIQVSNQPKDLSRLVLNSPLMKDARLNMKREREILSRDPPGAKSIEGKCYRCDFDRLLMTSIQTRSGDEGMTNIYFCPNCRNTWKD